MSGGLQSRARVAGWLLTTIWPDASDVVTPQALTAPAGHLLRRTGERYAPSMPIPKERLHKLLDAMCDRADVEVWDEAEGCWLVTLITEIHSSVPEVVVRGRGMEGVDILVRPEDVFLTDEAEERRAWLARRPATVDG